MREFGMGNYILSQDWFGRGSARLRQFMGRRIGRRTRLWTSMLDPWNCQVYSVREKMASRRTVPEARWGMMLEVEHENQRYSYRGTCIGSRPDQVR